MYRRYDHLMRDMIDQIIGQVRAGEMSVLLAARRMASHCVPLPVALRVVRAAMS